MFNRTESREQHPDDGALLAYLDCEQTEREQIEVRDHLKSCWACRARLGRLEDTISAFIDFRDRAFSAEQMQPPQGFRGFYVRLSRVLDEPVKVKFWCLPYAMVREYWERVSDLRLMGVRVYPAAMIVVMLAIAVVMSVIGRKKDSVPSATTLLAQSAWGETMDRSQLLRRTLIVEQKDATSGRVVRRRRIESWKSGSGPRARRVYDEDNAMIGGAWIKADGSRVQYQTKNVKQVSQSEEQLPMGGSIWELSPSASDFGRLVGTDAQLSVQATPAVYIVGYANTSAARPRVRSASLTLRRRDLHAVEQVFVIEERSGLSEYRIEEVDYERRTMQTADAKYFEPDIVAHSVTAPLEAPPLPIFVPATLDQEVQLFEGLDSVGALVGEQIDISHLPSGALRLHGLVATAERRSEILRALGGLAHSPAVKVELSTLDEAQEHDSGATPTRLQLDQIEIANTSFPAEADLRSYLLKSGVAGQSVSEQVYRISNATLEHAAASREHAIALQRIAALFTRKDVGAMDSHARAQWAAMVDKHAIGFAQHLRQMQADVGPAFGVPTQGGKQARTPHAEGFWDTIRLLDEMAILIDDGVRRSFTVRAQRPGAAPVKQREFWELVDSAIGLAESLPSEIND